MQLHYRTMGAGPALVILHGLFGMADNWQTLARRWAAPVAEGGLGRTLFLVDQRNHGRSPHSAEMNYDLLTQDLEEFFALHELQPDTVVLGHSMGGKVAMNFALQHPEKLARLIVVDIAPRAYPVHHRELLDGLLRIDIGQVKSRDEADRIMQTVAPEADTRLFLLKNLYRADDGRFAWRLNIEALDRHLPELSAEIRHGDPFLKPTLFIRGGLSKYVTSEDKYFHIERLFPNVEIETVVNVGHWVHAEAPDTVAELVRTFLAY